MPNLHEKNSHDQTPAAAKFKTSPSNFWQKQKKSSQTYTYRVCLELKKVSSREPFSIY